MFGIGRKKKEIEKSKKEIQKVGGLLRTNDLFKEELEAFSSDLFVINFGFFTVEETLWNVSQCAYSVDIELITYNDVEDPSPSKIDMDFVVDDALDDLEYENDKNVDVMRYINDTYYDFAVAEIRKNLMMYIETYYKNLFKKIESGMLEFELNVKKIDVFQKYNIQF